MPVIRPEVGGSLEFRSSRLAWPTQRNPVSTTKNTKISLVWWHTPVIPATQEAEAEELIEPGRCNEPRSRHYTLAWVTEQDFVSKKQTNIFLLW